MRGAERIVLRLISWCGNRLDGDYIRAKAGLEIEQATVQFCGQRFSWKLDYYRIGRGSVCFEPLLGDSGAVHRFGVR